jgi:HEAT repeat protein
MAPLAQAVSAEPGITLNQISEFVLFAARCRASPSVLMPLVDDEEMAVRGDVALGLLGLDSRRPLPAVKQLLGPTPNVAWRSGTSRLPEEWYRLRGLIGAPESDAIPILLPYLQNPDANVRALVASFLAHWGRGEAVEPLLETVLDPSITSTVRMHVVEALRWFSGDRIVAALDSILASEDLSSFHPYAYVGFAWTDPAVAIPRLLKGLEDPRARGEASMVFLTLDPTQAIPLLEAELDQLPEASQIEVVEALQRLGQKQYPELLREYMESGEKDGSMYPIASRALEHAYSHSPVTVALDALSSPVRDVRDIAIYGLSGHLSRNEVLDSLLSIIADPRDERQVRARLALWATRVAARQDALLDRGEEALVRGDVPRARAFFDRGGSEGMIGSVVMRRGTGRGLTPTSPHYSLRRVLMREFPYWAGWPGWRQRTLWNQYRAILSTGIPAPPLSEFFSYHFPYMVRELIMGPSWKAELRNDPILEPLREFYAFRVAIGLQEPIEVEMGPDGSFEMRSH